MIYTPQKRLYAPDDPFFQEGNIALRAIWLARDAESEHEIDMIREQADSIQKYRRCLRVWVTAALNPVKLAFRDLSRPIYCALPSCCSRQGVPAEFPSVTAYELHYETRHRNVCAACGKVFPGHHWLQLHLDECHNVLIQMRKDRGEKVVSCYYYLGGSPFSVFLMSAPLYVVSMLRRKLRKAIRFTKNAPFAPNWQAQVPKELPFRSCHDGYTVFWGATGSVYEEQTWKACATTSRSATGDGYGWLDIANVSLENSEVDLFWSYEA